jgi:hypothetical protein
LGEGVKMSVNYINAKIVTCDRCGKSVTLKWLERKELDGGYSHHDDYEKAPDGWSKSYGKNLCPVCSDHLAKLIEEFWKVED